MKLHFVTIVLDGMPFVSWHYPILRQLKLDWNWHVIEGVALPEGCTSWCANIDPRLSTDGTNKYLRDLAIFDKRITHIARTSWPGKTAMFNEALSRITDDEYLLWQLDSDEMWTRDQIELAFGFLDASSVSNCMWFRCRYFVGPDIVITSRTSYGNNEAYEWHRLWRVPRGTLFSRHEPPVMARFTEHPLIHADTERLGLIFDHFAHSTEAQMAFKDNYYGSSNNRNGHLWKGAVANWRRLQANTKWPINDLSAYLPWVGPGVTADRLTHEKAG